MKIRHLLISAPILLLTTCAYNQTTDEMEKTWLFGVILIAFILGLITAFNQNKKDEEAKRDRGEKFKKAMEDFHVSTTTGLTMSVAMLSVEYMNISAQKLNATKAFDNILPHLISGQIDINT